MEIKNRNVLITGCNRGIGKAFAMMCAKESAHLFLANRKANEALVAELKAKGAASVQEFEVDLSDRKSRQIFLQATLDLKVDILFLKSELARMFFVLEPSQLIHVLQLRI